ncbi:copper chaperone PCu(A)C [Natronoglycomyces albus]|uniref:Copper chaperone PCu(A)C n=1 Tax=Natronoglycomyces albus TaxID=2811108 RepID=A0A895XRB3_9ACTN|nr:copper chaperone PCu(A)C [Natronoglycomyces albus]QSB04138.1 copper chaperone PCu(A)C [Natronoglycomyces albus]
MTTARSLHTLSPRCLVGATAAFAATMTLIGCGSNHEPVSETPASTMADAVTVTDAWVAATDDAMTAAFGIIENSSATEVRIVEVASELSIMELHEVVAVDGNTTMRQKEAGFTIPAHGEHELVRGGDHFMFMSLEEPITAGDIVAITLIFDDDSELTVDTIAKDATGGEEEYESGDNHADHTEHDHNGHGKRDSV